MQAVLPIHVIYNTIIAIIATQLYRELCRNSLDNRVTTIAINATQLSRELRRKTLMNCVVNSVGSCGGNTNYSFVKKFQL